MKDSEQRLIDEARFHDSWAASVEASDVDVIQRNEACTAPEMRAIRKELGDLKGRRVLDVGCGIGEASVYFATLGADVTAADLSEGMLKLTTTLASRYKVKVRTHLCQAETLGFSRGEKFDVIYVGNLLHHVEIAPTLDRLTRLLAPGGVLVSWDPVAYNPLINVYRKIATQVRTEDEHPLTMGDLRKFKGRFRSVQTRWFWLSTLLIFILMAVIQKKNPNKVRYWKAIIDDADRWAWLYRPLERIDRVLLALFPFLRPLCWNVLVIARDPV